MPCKLTFYRRPSVRIQAAVEAGEMTREEAGEMLEGYRRRMATRSKRARTSKMDALKETADAGDKNDAAGNKGKDDD